MKLFNINSLARVYAYDTPIHMGAAFRKLSELIEKKLDRDPQDGELYVFHNKKKTYVKVLWYHKNGTCIFAKRLDHAATFDVESNVTTLKELQAMVDEVVINKGRVKRHLKAA